MRLTLLALLAAFSTAGPAAGPAAGADPSLEADVAKLVKMKQEVEAFEADLRKRIGDLQKLYPELFGPVPVPPAPPPKPVDALKVKLRAAFEADKGAASDAHQLAALYAQAAALARDPAVPSTAELLRRVREAGSSLVGADTLKGVRQVVAEELRVALGKSDDDPLTAEERAAAAELFAKLAGILEGF